MIILNYLLGYKNLKIYQDTDMFHFSLDSILLPNFVTLRKNDKKILDIGTGNAVIPLILTTRTKSDIVGVEVQQKSYELGVKSVDYNDLEDQIKLINMDIKEYASQCESDQFDVITCNPPFFKIGEESHLNDNYEKTIARHEIKLNIEDVIKISRKLLKNNGSLALVHRPERLIEILSLMKKNNIEPKKIQFVYPKHDREANILLIEGTKNGKTGIKVLPPIYTHEENGEYTEQIQKYFIRGDENVSEKL